MFARAFARFRIEESSSFSFALSSVGVAHHQIYDRLCGMVVPVPGMPFTPSREETIHFCQLSYGAELRAVVWQWPGILNDSFETYADSLGGLQSFCQHLQYFSKLANR